MTAVEIGSRKYIFFTVAMMSLHSRRDVTITKKPVRVQSYFYGFFVIVTSRAE